MPHSMTSTFSPDQECPILARMRGLHGYNPPTQEFELGKDDYGCEFKVFGATSGKYLLWDESDDQLEVPVLSLSGQSGAECQALLIGAGSDASPATTAVASKNFIEFRCESTATGAGSDSRAAYIRLYLAGATTGGGEAMRAFTTVEAAIGTAHGAHLSLNFGTSGSISGQAIASRNTLHAKNATSGAGTFAALQAEVWSDGSSTDISAATVYSFIRAVNGGDATGLQNVEDNAFFIEFAGGTAASGNMISQAVNEPTWNTKTHKIRCRLPDGTTCYLIAVID